MDPFHERLARVALEVAAAYGFALAGGYAVQAHGFLDRPSADVDLFAEASAQFDFPKAVDAVIVAYKQDGLEVHAEARSSSFARLSVSATTGEQARVELGVDWRMNEPIRLAEVTKAALDVPRPGIDRLGLDVRSDLQPAVLRGDPLLLHQLVANLIDNAVGHNIAGGDVLVATSTSDSRAIVSAANSGQVIAPAEVDRLLQPFQRLGTRSARRGDGHGLGLSIAAAITAAHDARLTLRPRPGGVLAVRVVFPAQPPVWPRPARR